MPLTIREAEDLVWDLEDAVVQCERNSYRRRDREDLSALKDRVVAALTNKEVGC